MFDLSFGEIALIGLLILVFFDVEQLPGLMRQAGRVYAKVRGASAELRRAFNVEVAKAEADQRREEMELRREEVVKLRKSRAPPAPRAAPDDAVMRPTRGPPPPDSAAAERAAAETEAAALTAGPAGSEPTEPVPVNEPPVGSDDSGDSGGTS